MRPIIILNAAILLLVMAVPLELPLEAPFSISNISDSQPLVGPAFIGYPASTNPLRPKARFTPATSLMHGDGGNTGSTDFAGPTGRHMTINSATQSLGVMLWSANGHLTAGIADISPGSASFRLGIAAYDPDTMQVLASWYPPDENQLLNIGYMELILEDNVVVVSSKQGHIYLVRRTDCAGTTSFAMLRDIDLTSERVLASSEQLLNAMSDTEGNIWFTTGGILGGGDPMQPSSTVGYVEGDNTIHTLHIPDQMFENGIAVDQTTMYGVSGPSGPENDDDNIEATGYAWAFTVGQGNDITTLWKVSYSAGSGTKPGGFARGSGTTPSLLGSQYIAITDNALPQINLLILQREVQPDRDQQIFCKVPLFASGASSSDIRPTAHWDGETHRVVILNNYNAPPLFQPRGANIDINGPFNNMTIMAGGIVSVVVRNIGCEVGWELDEKIKSVPVLSTKTGIFYGYVLDDHLARDGQYIWYIVAIDWRSGNVIWKSRAGAGGVFNDNFGPGSLGRDGKFYQSVVGGLIWARDEK